MNEDRFDATSWFDEAAYAATKTKAAAAAAEALAKQVAGLGKVVAPLPSNPALVRKAREDFNASRPGSSGPQERIADRVRSTLSKKDIADHITNKIWDSADPRKEAGEWLTLLTNVITDIVKEINDQEK